MKTFEIRRRVARIPYARNGNVGMNKPEYVWDVFRTDGRRVMLGCPTLREAKTYVGRGTFRIVR